MENKKNKLEVTWYWLDQTDEVVSEPLSQLDLHSTLLFEKELSQLSDIYVWSKGMEQWTQLIQCTVLAPLVMDLKRDWSTSETPPVFVSEKPPEFVNPELTSEVETSDSENSPPSNRPLEKENRLKLKILAKLQPQEEPKKVERRLHERKPLKLKVLLTNNKNTFLTFTRNISMTGLQIEGQVSKEFVGEGIQILIEDSRTKKRIKLNCKGIIEKDNIERICFTDLTDTQNEVLKLLLDEVSSNTAPIKKIGN